MTSAPTPTVISMDDARLAEQKCLTPGCIYHSRIAAEYMSIAVSLPETRGGFRHRLAGLLGHLTIPERGTPSKHGELGALYESALHDAIEPAVAAILRADIAYKAVAGHVGNPDGPLRDKAYEAARVALLRAKITQGSESRG